MILTAPNTDSVLSTIASRCLELRLDEGTKKTELTKLELDNLSFSKKLELTEKTTLEKQISFWENKLAIAATETNVDKTKLKKLHRYNKTLLKLKKAENFSVNKKLLALIATLESPNET